jgi:hypothetical protein
VWCQLEAFEAMAYEQKVAAQVRTLDEATGSLWHLHKALVATRRQLERHQRDLHRHAAGSKDLQTGNRRRMPGSGPERNAASGQCLGDNPLPGFSRV